MEKSSTISDAECGHSERELMFATEELKRLHQDHPREYAISGRRLADYLASVEAEEVLLKQQLCDGESTGIRSVPSVIEPGATDGDPVKHDDAHHEVFSSEPLVRCCNSTVVLFIREGLSLPIAVRGPWP